MPGKLVLRLLGALAPPLILAAIVHTFMTTHLGGPAAVRATRLLLMNTLVAITIWLTVANGIQPGRGADLAPSETIRRNHSYGQPTRQHLLETCRKPAGSRVTIWKVIGVIFVAVAFGMALRIGTSPPLGTVETWSNWCWSR